MSANNSVTDFVIDDSFMYVLVAIHKEGDR